MKAEMNAAAYVKSGIEYFEKGDYDRAIADTTEAIRLNPNDALAYGTRGTAYKGKKDFNHAIEDLTEAIRLDPNNAPAYGNRGLTYLAKGDHNQAISDLKMAVKIQPENDGLRQTLKKIIEAIKKEIRVILIGAGVVAFIGGIIGLLVGMSDGPGVAAGMAVAGIWMGLGVGGNITFVPSLFRKGLGLFDGLNSKYGIGALFASLLIRLIAILFFVGVGLWAFCIAGPIWPLIRILKKRNQIKEGEK